MRRIENATFSTGVDIPNLHQVIFAASYKSLIKIVQAIGRGLRKHASKDVIKLFDIVDDFSVKQGTGRRIHKNATFKHSERRLEIYKEQEFNYEIIDINADEL